MFIVVSAVAFGALCILYAKVRTSAIAEYLGTCGEGVDCSRVRAFIEHGWIMLPILAVAGAAFIRWLHGRKR